eukprot:GHVU01014740.1.p1 GENE.GHVU01014740.1~~GHVU01014740.1.p1  ORF type:complete len:224 (+),score=22.77 GHVU01014740.1:313-984(+)
MPEERPVPSRMSLQQFKLRKKGASQGHQLLKKKSDALTAKFRGMLKDIVATKKELGKEIGDASFALAKASWASGGDFKSKIAAGIKRPGVTLMVSSDNVAGVRLPVFTVHTDASVDVMGHIGVASGGQVMLSAREQYLRALASVVKLASLQTSFFTLDQQIKMTNRRVNALDNVRSYVDALLVLIYVCAYACVYMCMYVCCMFVVCMCVCVSGRICVRTCVRV